MRAVRPALLLAVCTVAAATLSLGCGRGAHRRVPGGTVRQTSLAGVSLYTVEVGERRHPVRYVIHGGPGLDHTYLQPWMDFLSADGRVVYVDLRGHGRSSTPPDAEGYALTAAADDLATLARVRGDGPVDIVAHGFGAAVALSLAGRHPEAVRKLVLVDPLRDGGQVRAYGRRAVEALGATGWARVQSLETPQGTLRDSRKLPELFHRMGALWWHRPPSDAVIDGMVRAMVYRPDADANFTAESLGVDARITAADVRAPVLVITGDDDRMYLPGESRALADVLPHGRFAVVAGAGYLPFVEQPAAFARVVREFLGTAPVAE